VTAPLPRFPSFFPFRLKIENQDFFFFLSWPSVEVLLSDDRLLAFRTREPRRSPFFFFFPSRPLVQLKRLRSRTPFFSPFFPFFSSACLLADVKRADLPNTRTGVLLLLFFPPPLLFLSRELLEKESAPRSHRRGSAFFPFLLSSAREEDDIFLRKRSGSSLAILFFPFLFFFLPPSAFFSLADLIERAGVRLGHSLPFFFFFLSSYYSEKIRETSPLLFPFSFSSSSVRSVMKKRSASKEFLFFFFSLLPTDESARGEPRHPRPLSSFSFLSLFCLG